MPEMIFIFLLALVIFGPKKMPELGRQLGKALAEFKKASNDFKNQLEVEMMNIELEERSKKQEVERASTERSILPVEKLYDTISGPPGAVSRGSLEPYTVPPTTEPASVASEPAGASADPTLSPAETPVNGNVRVTPDA